MSVNYGVLKGTVTGHLRNADDDHYQILVHGGTTVFRIASNVKSSAPHAPSTVLFEELDTLPAAFISELAAFTPGFTKLSSTPGGLAIDYVRGGLVDTKAMKPVPADAPGVNNDLKDKLENAVVTAMAMEGSIIYAFGSRWGPEQNKPDQYFKFVPGNGVHDIHMNQGNGGQYERKRRVPGRRADDRVSDNTWRAFFFAFQSQTFDTDANGNPISGG